MKPFFGRRILAVLIDYALILAWMAVLGLVSLVTFLVTGSLFNWLSLGVLGAQLLGFLVLVLPVGIYLYATESSSRQATFGKRVMRIRVVSAAALGRPSRSQVLVRTIVKLAPWEFAHFFVWHLMAALLVDRGEFPPWIIAGLVVADLLPLAYVGAVLLQRDGRGPHDMVAGTRVVTGSSRD